MTRTKAEQACAVEGCDHTDLQGHGWCRMHYYRWRRSGDTGEGSRRQRENRGQCIVEGCDKQDAGPAGLCSMHATRVKRHGDHTVKLSPGPEGGESCPFWLEDPEVTYNAIHIRIKRMRGSATLHPCAHCQTKPAHQWAYDHSDPNERKSQYGPYSPDQSRYFPLCASCHKKFDLAYRRSLV